MLYPLGVKKTKFLHIYRKKQPYLSEFLTKTVFILLSLLILNQIMLAYKTRNSRPTSIVY